MTQMYTALSFIFYNLPVAIKHENKKFLKVELSD